MIWPLAIANGQVLSADIWKIANGKLTERWDVQQPIKPGLDPAELLSESPVSAVGLCRTQNSPSYSSLESCPTRLESRDGGDTWQRFEEGLRHKYFWSIAVDTADADTSPFRQLPPRSTPTLNRQNHISIGARRVRRGRSSTTACPSRPDAASPF
ncbi:MAG: hypothetical protein WB586_13780 [Chthoniobacterales bacterium]